ncbi:MAG: ParB/RepB/Spo0J family partition protein [Minisyncoccia bacterium]|jgi:ParB family chromosome partitioning protein
MLGKGLESLIPKKGDGSGGGGGNGNGGGSGGQNVPSSQPPVSQTPAPQALALPPDSEMEIVRADAAREEPRVAPPIEARAAAAPISQPQSQPQQPQPARPQLQPTVPPASDAAKAFNGEPQEMGSVFHIEVDRITPNPNQPRRNFDEAGLRDLAHSIREFGFLQPLVVSRIEKETSGGVGVAYQLVAGERRLLAAKMLGLATVPAIIRNVDLEREKLELAVLENIQRENLNPIEAARAFQRLQEEFRMTQREIAAKLGKSREVVANAVRLLDLPEYIRTAVEKGTISESSARLLLAVPDPGAQQRLFEDIVQHGLTTRDVRERVGELGSSVAGGRRRGRPPKSAEAPLPPELKAMQESLSADLGAPVTIHKGAGTGKITIAFYSEEELENILRRLGSGS